MIWSTVACSDASCTRGGLRTSDSHVAKVEQGGPGGKSSQIFDEVKPFYEKITSIFKFCNFIQVY